MEINNTANNNDNNNNNSSDFGPKLKHHQELNNLNNSDLHPNHYGLDDQQIALSMICDPYSSSAPSIVSDSSVPQTFMPNYMPPITAYSSVIDSNKILSDSSIHNLQQQRPQQQQRWNKATCANVFSNEDSVPIPTTTTSSTLLDNNNHFESNNSFDMQNLQKIFLTLTEDSNFLDLATWPSSSSSSSGCSDQLKNLSAMKFSLYQLIIRQLLNDGYASVAVSLQQKIDPASINSALDFTAENTLFDLYSIFCCLETRSKTDAKFTNLLRWFLSLKADKANAMQNHSFMTQPTTSMMMEQQQHAPNVIYETAEQENKMSFAAAVADSASSGNFVALPQHLHVIYKFGEIGNGPGCLDAPHGFCLGIDNDIVIADTNNHRICVFTLQGEFRYSFGEYGTDEGKLHQPRKIAMLPPSIFKIEDEILLENQSPIFIVCDRGNKRSRMQVFSTKGDFIRLIEIPSMDIVSGLTTTQDRKIAVVDSVRSTVMVMDEFGHPLNWFSCAPIMVEPSDIALHRKHFYICDFKGHCVCVFDSHGEFSHSLKAKTLKFPNGIDVSDYGDIIVGDSHGNRFHISVFRENGDLMADYDCPFVKVSRCCGLRLTKDGLIVTLAKNNNHVVVMNSITIGS